MSSCLYLGTAVCRPLFCLCICSGRVDTTVLGPCVGVPVHSVRRGVRGWVGGGGVSRAVGDEAMPGSAQSAPGPSCPGGPTHSHAPAGWRLDFEKDACETSALKKYQEVLRSTFSSNVCGLRVGYLAGWLWSSGAALRGASGGVFLLGKGCGVSMHALPFAVPAGPRPAAPPQCYRRRAPTRARSRVGDAYQQ